MADGSVIVGDIWNKRVVHFDSGGNKLGVLFTLPVGTNPYGLAVDKARGTVYVGMRCCEVQKWTPDAITGVYTQQTSLRNSKFQYPSRVTVADDGTVYVADMNAAKVFVFGPTGGFQFTFGSFGIGPGQFKQPRGLAFDGSSPQRLYVMDAANERVQVFDKTGTFLFKFGSNGTGHGQFSGDNSRGLAIDRTHGWIYAVDDQVNLVHKFDLSGTWLLDIGGTGGRSATTCCSTPPGLFDDGGREVAVDGNGNVWVGDMPDFRVQVFAPDGQFVLQYPPAAQPQYPPAGAFNFPEGVAVDSAGNVTVSDARNFRLQKFDPTGALVWSEGLRGRFNGYAFNYARGISADPVDGSLVVADTYNGLIKKFGPDGTLQWSDGSAGGGNAPGQFSHPSGVTVGPDQRIYVADSANWRVQVLSPSGAYLATVSAPAMRNPYNVGVDAATGELYVTGYSQGQVFHFTNGGVLLGTIGVKGTADNQLQQPWGIAVDDTNIYVSDTPANKIKVFNKADGSFKVAFGESGNGIGQLRGPEALNLGPTGVLYVADTFNDRITPWCLRSCTTAPTSPIDKPTVGQSGQAQMYPSGLAVDAAGSVAVADTGNDRIELFPAGRTTASWTVGVRGAPIGGGTDSFGSPRDVAMDSTYVYVADTDNGIVQVLKKLDGSYVRTMAFAFNAPIGVSVGSDGAGNERILVSDGTTGNVDVFDTSDHHLLTIPPTTSTSGTRDAATDSLGNVYTADFRNNRVNKYSPIGTLLLQWGGGAAPCQQISKPFGVDVDDAGRVYVASSDGGQIKAFNSDGSCVSTFGTRGAGPGQLLQLRRVAVGRGQTPVVYAADLWGLKILAYNSDGTLLANSQLGNGVIPAAGGLNEARTVAVTSQYIYVADTVNQRMTRYNLDGSSPIVWGAMPESTASGSFNWAQGVAVNPVTGNVWVANTRNNRLDEFAADGTGPLRTLASGSAGGAVTFNWPTAVSFDPAGTMYVADTSDADIQAFSVTPLAVTLLWKAGSRGSGTGQFNAPHGVTYDGSGSVPRLLITDTRNNRIVALDPASGNWLGVLPMSKGTQPGQVLGPEGITVTTNGALWVADTGNNRIEMFNNDGTFANELVGSYGTGNNQFNAPQDIQIGPDGLLYVADTFNNRIQVFQPV